MNTTSIANQEEAAYIASEFMSGLDNLPNEVQHLLAEIRHLETRIQEIQQEIHKETTRYIRHGLKGSAAAAAMTKESNGKDNKDTKDKDALIPGRIDVLFAEADKISQEKITLAQRLVDTLTRVNAKLDHDLGRVISLSGEGPQEQYEVQRGYVVGVVPAAPNVGSAVAISSAVPAVSAGVVGGGIGAVGLPVTGARNPIMEKVVDSLRAASVGELPSASAAPSPSASQLGPPTKRRRVGTGVGTGTSQGISSSRAHTPQQRSRLTQQSQPSPPRGRKAPSSVGDEDAEGEEDEDAEGDAEGEEGDEEIYCECQSMSYGEMIGCDNTRCKYQWFHLDCVGLKPPLPESWYCKTCLKEMGGVPGANTSATSAPRKGRKKAA